MKPEWLDKRTHTLPFSFTLCTKREQYHELINTFNINYDERPPFVNEGAHATTHYFNKGKDHDSFTVVCVNEDLPDDPIVVAGLLVHEAIHVWQTYMDSIHERNPGREMEAYGIQWISQELMWEFKRQIDETS